MASTPNTETSTNPDVVTGGTAGSIVGKTGEVVGFYGSTGVAKQTGVAVSAAAVHAALVALGLISA